MIRASVYGLTACALLSLAAPASAQINGSSAAMVRSAPPPAPPPPPHKLKAKPVCVWRSHKKICRPAAEMKLKAKS